MFSHTLSKILYDKGLSSEDGRWWVKNRGKIEVWNETDISYDTGGMEKIVPAFNFLDILNKENAVKLWGDDICKWCGSNDFTYYDDAPDYGFCNKCTKAHNRGGNHDNKLHELLDIYLSEGEQAVEDRLVEMLNQK